MNKDKVAKKYLEGLEKDQKRFRLYIEAVKKINEMKINEALGLLLVCQDSDFNTIDVNNYLCTCYIKKGDLKKAKEKLERVMQIDRNNYMALENRKILIKYGEIKNKVNIKVYFYGVCAIVLCIIIFFSIKPMIKLVSNVKPMTTSVKDNAEVSVNNLNTKMNFNNTLKIVTIITIPMRM